MPGQKSLRTSWDHRATISEDAMSETCDCFSVKDNAQASEHPSTAASKAGSAEDPEEDALDDSQDRRPLVLVCVVAVLLVAFLALLVITAKREEELPFLIRQAVLTRVDGEDTGTDSDLGFGSASGSTQQVEETSTSIRPQRREALTLKYSIAVSTTAMDAQYNGTDLNGTLAE